MAGRLDSIERWSAVIDVTRSTLGRLLEQVALPGVERAALDNGHRALTRLALGPGAATLNYPTDDLPGRLLEFADDLELRGRVAAAAQMRAGAGYLLAVWTRPAEHAADLLAALHLLRESVVVVVDVLTANPRPAPAREMAKPSQPIYTAIVSPECLCLWQADAPDGMTMVGVDRDCVLHGPGQPFDAVTEGLIL